MGTLSSARRSVDLAHASGSTDSASVTLWCTGEACGVDPTSGRIVTRGRSRTRCSSSLIRATSRRFRSNRARLARVGVSMPEACASRVRNSWDVSPESRRTMLGRAAFASSVVASIPISVGLTSPLPPRGSCATSRKLRSSLTVNEIAAREKVDNRLRCSNDYKFVGVGADGLKLVAPPLRIGQRQITAACRNSKGRARSNVHGKVQVARDIGNDSGLAR